MSLKIPFLLDAPKLLPRTAYHIIEIVNFNDQKANTCVFVIYLLIKLTMFQLGISLLVSVVV